MIEYSDQSETNQRTKDEVKRNTEGGTHENKSFLNRYPGSDDKDL